MQDSGTKRLPKHVRVSLALLPWASAGMLLMLASTIERKLFPVVTDFHVQEIIRFDDAVLISGIMRKERPCAFAGVSATGIADEGETALSVKFMDVDTDSNRTRPPGSQAWGPWRIVLPYAPKVTEINLSAYHDCHWIWTTKTSLAKVPVTEVPR